MSLHSDRIVPKTDELISDLNCFLCLLQTRDATREEGRDIGLLFLESQPPAFPCRHFQSTQSRNLICLWPPSRWLLHINNRRTHHRGLSILLIMTKTCCISRCQFYYCLCKSGHGYPEGGPFLHGLNYKLPPDAENSPSQIIIENWMRWSRWWNASDHLSFLSRQSWGPRASCLLLHHHPTRRYLGLWGQRVSAVICERGLIHSFFLGFNNVCCPLGNMFHSHYDSKDARSSWMTWPMDHPSGRGNAAH